MRKSPLRFVVIYDLQEDFVDSNLRVNKKRLTLETLVVKQRFSGENFQKLVGFSNLFIFLNLNWDSLASFEAHCLCLLFFIA